ncbi:MAG: hypothetical protein QM811_01600 [Pirellulales bacterium]
MHARLTAHWGPRRLSDVLQAIDPARTTILVGEDHPEEIQADLWRLLPRERCDVGL